MSLKSSFITRTKPWAPSPVLKNLNMVVRICKPNAGDMEARSEVQSHSLLYTKFKASLGHIRNRFVFEEGRRRGKKWQKEKVEIEIERDLSPITEQLSRNF